MTNADLIALVNQLRAETSEKEWIEFKQTRVHPNERLGEYLSALANSAALAFKPYGYLVLGVHDTTHDVVGTTFDYRTEKRKGNEDLWFGTTTRLRPPVAVDAFEVPHPAGRVVVFRIAAAHDQPVSYERVEYVRVNESNTLLSNYPEKRRALWNLQTDWSAQIVPGATLADLDPEAIAEARVQFAEKHPKRAEDLKKWDDATFLNKARATIRGQVTNAAILLLGFEESAALLSPAVAKLSWFLWDANDEPLDYEHFGPPFLLTVDALLGRIRNLKLRELPDGTLFPREIQQYDDFVIREALHNAIAHQDYTAHARVQVIETPTRLVLTNRGRFIPGSVEEVIERDAPPDLYRNRFLVEAMVKLNMIDTEGGGIRKMYKSQANRFLPLPDYDLSTPEQVVVTIPGAILDREYTRLLMRRDDLGLRQVFLLDKVQKGESIPPEDRQRLKALGLVEGRSPNLIIASSIAKETGGKARHIRQRGLDNAFYRKMVVQLVREHQPVTREDIDALLWDKLPDALDDKQKGNRIHNLLKTLSHHQHIENRGGRRYSQWFLGPVELPKEDGQETKGTAL